MMTPLHQVWRDGKGWLIQAALCEFDEQGLIRHGLSFVAP